MMKLRIKWKYKCYGRATIRVIYPSSRFSRLRFTCYSLKTTSGVRVSPKDTMVIFVSGKPTNDVNV